MDPGDNNGENQQPEDVPEEDMYFDLSGATGDAPTGMEEPVDRFVERHPEPLQPRPNTARRVTRPAGSSRTRLRGSDTRGSEIPESAEAKLEDIKSHLRIFIQRRVLEVETAHAVIAELEANFATLSEVDQVRVVHGARHLRWNEFNEAGCIQAIFECADADGFFAIMFRVLLDLRTRSE